MKYFRSRKGFTLVEILIVVVMLAILFAIAVPIYSRYVAGARSAEAQEAINAVWAAAKIHNAETGVWASNIDRLDRLQLEEVTLNRWDITLSRGGSGLNAITATSTGLMPGGAGKRVTLTIDTGQWSGYGFDEY